MTQNSLKIQIGELTYHPRGLRLKHLCCRILKPVKFFPGSMAVMEQDTDLDKIDDIKNMMTDRRLWKAFVKEA